MKIRIVREGSGAWKRGGRRGFRWKGRERRKNRKKRIAGKQQRRRKGIRRKKNIKKWIDI
jgi:hypothetical protein